MKVWVPGDSKGTALEGVNSLVMAATEEHLAAAKSLMALFPPSSGESESISCAVEEVFGRIHENGDHLRCIELRNLSGAVEICSVFSENYDGKNFDLAVAETAEKLVVMMMPLAEFINGELPEDIEVRFVPIGDVHMGEGGDYTNELIMRITEEVELPVTIKIVYVIENTGPPGSTEQSPINRFYISMEGVSEEGEI